jgi:hypothetical protein
MPLCYDYIFIIISRQIFLSTNQKSPFSAFFTGSAKSKIIYRFLKNNEIINIELADKITKGPAGSANALKSKIPETQEIAPIIKAPKEY